MKDISFKFDRYELSELSFVRNNLFKLDDNFKFSIEPEFEMNFKRKGKKKLIITLGLNIKGEKLPFSLSLAIEGFFTLNRIDINDKDVKKLAFINCNAILFPFLRELIAEITRRAGLTPLLLPSVNFVSLYETQNKQPAKKK